MLLIVILGLAILVFLLFRYGVFVIDRKVFDFQASPIIKRGVIRNIREYRIMHNYIEMLFEKDPNGSSSNHDSKKLDSMMSAYHSENS